MDKDIEIERLREALIKERTNHIVKMNDAYPDVGMGITESFARKKAINQLKKEGLIP